MSVREVGIHCFTLLQGGDYFGEFWIPLLYTQIIKW